MPSSVEQSKSPTSPGHALLLLSYWGLGTDKSPALGTDGGWFLCSFCPFQVKEHVDCGRWWGLRGRSFVIGKVTWVMFPSASSGFFCKRVGAFGHWWSLPFSFLSEYICLHPSFLPPPSLKIYDLWCLSTFRRAVLVKYFENSNSIALFGILWAAKHRTR